MQYRWHNWLYNVNIKLYIENVYCWIVCPFCTQTFWYAYGPFTSNIYFDNVHKNKLCRKVLPHFPTCWTLISRFCWHEARVSWHSLKYVFPFEPHTGSLMYGQLSSHRQRPLPVPTRTHISPNEQLGLSLSFPQLTSDDKISKWCQI